MQRLPPNMEVSSRNSPAPAGRKMVLVAHHGAGGEIAVNVLDPKRWRCHCILAPKPKLAMVGARTVHTVTHTDGKSGTRLLSIEGEIGSGGNVGAVSSRNQTKFPYSSYKLGRSGAVQIFTFSCVQNPRLQCLVFKWASLSHWLILWTIELCIWSFTSRFHSFITNKCICALIWAVIFTQSFIINWLILTFN